MSTNHTSQHSCSQNKNNRFTVSETSPLHYWQNSCHANWSDSWIHLRKDILKNQNKRNNRALYNLFWKWDSIRSSFICMLLHNIFPNYVPRSCAPNIISLRCTRPSILFNTNEQYSMFRLPMICIIFTYVCERKRHEEAYKPRHFNKSVKTTTVKMIWTPTPQKTPISRSVESHWGESVVKTLDIRIG